MRKLSRVLLILMLCLAWTTLANAQVGFEVRLTQIFRVPGKLDVDVEIRSTGSPFVLATSTFVFNYNTAGLGSPTKVSTNDGPWDNPDADYQNVSLNSGAIGGTAWAGLTVVFLGGDDNNGAVVPSTFTRIGTVQFTILDPSQSSNLVWRAIGAVTEAYELTNPGVNSAQDPITFSGTFSDPGSAPLPIQMTSFSASIVRDNEVEVAWKTVSETNNFGFEIYRKRNETGEWKKLDFVQGHGTTLSAQAYSYTDKSVGFGKYLYQLKQIDLDGKSKTYPEMEVLVGVEPDRFFLAQNYPNPFNPSTVIEFVVPTSGFATMKVYNVLGQEVATLFDGKAEAGKINSAQFNASNLPSGLYFYALRSAGKSDTKRMLLVK
ncbi:MAG: T9SS type A sorting domain-containing protein [Bacteroidota bacterium]